MPDVNPIPTHYPRISPYMCVNDAAAAIVFYKQVLGATERMRIPMPDGKIGHCELVLGEGMFMLSDEFPEIDVLGPKAIGGTAVAISVYVEDVDAVYQRAIELGAIALRPVEDQFFGDRSGQFLDPFGHRWSVASHIEDLSPAEINERAAKAMG